MNSQSVVTTSPGLSLPIFLTILFTVLKLTGVINWSWVWVLSPLWISFVVGFIILTVVGLIALAIALREGW